MISARLETASGRADREETASGRADREETASGRAEEMETASGGADREETASGRAEEMEEREEGGASESAATESSGRRRWVIQNISRRLEDVSFEQISGFLEVGTKEAKIVEGFTFTGKHGEWEVRSVGTAGFAIQNKSITHVVPFHKISGFLEVGTKEAKIVEGCTFTGEYDNWKVLFVGFVCPHCENVTSTAEGSSGEHERTCERYMPESSVELQELLRGMGMSWECHGNQCGGGPVSFAWNLLRLIWGRQLTVDHDAALALWRPAVRARARGIDGRTAELLEAEESAVWHARWSKTGDTESSGGGGICTQHGNGVRKERYVCGVGEGACVVVVVRE